MSPYEAFPYGMGLDYERKFAYCVRGMPVIANRLRPRPYRVGTFQRRPTRNVRPFCGIVSCSARRTPGRRSRASKRLRTVPTQLERAAERLDDGHVRRRRGGSLIAGDRPTTANPKDLERDR